MRKLLCGLLVILALGIGSVSADDDIDNIKEENAQLRQRVEKMEQELKEIKKLLSERQITAEPTTPPPVAKVTEKEKPTISTKYPVELYGYIKLDAAYDTARTDNGNFPRWVLSEATNDNDDEFNITARQSRFGLNFNGPDISSGTKTSGKVEVDFYEGGEENKNRLMMRHAYLQLEWPDTDFSLLAGQTTDLMSPLFPDTLNYSILWWSGNPGYRRPQLRLTKEFDVRDNSNFILQGALARTIGDTGTGFDPGDTGEDSGFPTLQGRAAYSFPLLTEKKTTVGISGHWGEEEYDIDNTGTSIDYDTWSGNIDLTLPVVKKLAFKGELWTGENLDTYFAGIGQGVNTTLQREIGATGGWVALNLGPFNKWRFNFGGGVDNPDDDDLSDGSRSKNVSIFGNVLYDINESVQTGLEISHWKTDYKNMENGDSIRIQSSLIYKF